MANRKRKKIGRLNIPEAISEMIEWEDKGQNQHPRYLAIRIRFPKLKTSNFRKTKPATS